MYYVGGCESICTFVRAFHNNEIAAINIKSHMLEEGVEGEIYFVKQDKGGNTVIYDSEYDAYGVITSDGFHRLYNTAYLKQFAMNGKGKYINTVSSLLDKIELVFEYSTEIYIAYPYADDKYIYSQSEGK